MPEKGIRKNEKEEEVVDVIYVQLHVNICKLFGSEIIKQGHIT
jgi:hypothetical protein